MAIMFDLKQNLTQFEIKASQMTRFGGNTG